MRQEIPKLDEHVHAYERESFGDLLNRLATASAGLVRDEIDLAKQELHEKTQSLQTGVVIVATAALFAIMALLALNAALIIGIGNAIGFGWAALAVGVFMGIVGAILAIAGIGKLKKTKLKPERTISSLKEDREWILRSVK